MAEEFSESEVVFSDNHHSPRDDKCFVDECQDVVAPTKRRSSPVVLNGKKKTVANSLPVNIPERMVRRWDSDAEEVEDKEDMVPPHVIVGGRITGKMAFSVCTGNGRTLKGRDLSQVRNSVLRLTGFLEV